MTHVMYTFRLHRTGVILVAAGLLLFSILIFAAGYLSGLRRRPAAVAGPAATPTASSVMPVPSAIEPDTATVAPPTLEAAGVAPAAGPAVAPAGSLTLQVGLFLSQEDAQEQANRLAAAKLPVNVTPTNMESGPVYAVRIGQFVTRREAVATADELFRRYGISGSVVTTAPPLRMEMSKD